MDKNTMYADLLEHLDAASVLAARLGLPSEGLHVYHDAVLYSHTQNNTED